jgi:large subunit ribosomal protein L12
MEYVYASLLLHTAGKEITEENIKKVLEAAGIQADENRIKMLVAALKEVNIDEVIKQATAAPVVAAAAPTAPAPAAAAPSEEKKEEEEEEKEVSEEEIAEGISSLFG